LNLNLSVNYRVVGPWYVRVNFGNKELEATAVNISEGGIAIITGHNIPVSSSLELMFSLFKINRYGEVCFYNPTEITGRVRSNTVCGNNQYRLGLSFVEAESEVNKRIGAFVRSAG